MSEYRSLSAGPRKSRKPLVLVVLLLIALAAVLYVVRGGHLSGASGDPESLHSLRWELSAARAELKEVGDALEVQRTRHTVDRRALELVRLEMAAQKEYTSDLEEDLRFYKSLMSPQGLASGLSARAPELVALDGTGRYAFRIVIVQAARKHQLVKGSLSLEVNGLFGEEQVSYTLAELAELADDPIDGELALQFRYFQAIEGDFTLPDGLEPTSLTVVASASKPSKLEFREQFPWQLQERFTHVGK
jgi:hypothetical protein